MQGKIQRLSAYNPLDLFSGSPQRMEAALAALFEEPQNNLRLFLGGAAVQLPKDGKLPGGPTMQQLGGVSGLIRLLRIILLREGSPRTSCCKSPMSVQLLGHAIPRLSSFLVKARCMCSVLIGYLAHQKLQTSCKYPINAFIRLAQQYVLQF